MQSQNQPESSAEAFLNAVNLLFHSNEKEMRDKANKFLIDFETKPESWDIAYQILLKDGLPEEAYFNALNILNRKIKFDFGNYSENPEYIEKLLSFLESNIDRFKQAKNYILLKYCDCIGKAFLFTGDKFTNFLKKFTMKLYGQNSDINNLICLLLIFNFICETGFDKEMVIDEKSSKNIQENIKNISGDVFQFSIFMINKLNTIENVDLKNFITKHILDTLNNYLSIKLKEDIILKFNNDYLPIVNFIFQINEKNLEKHSECICNLLYLPLHEESMRTLAKFIFAKILEFKDIFYKTIESLDAEQTSFYIDVFTLMVDNNLEEILKEKRYDLIQIILDLMKKCPPNKIDIICDFFKSFNYYLYQINLSYEDIMKNFKNLFLQLILNLINLTKFEDNIFIKLNKSKTKVLKSEDEYNATLDFRYSARDILVDFIQNYEFNFIFEEILFPEFNKIVLKIKEDYKNIMYWCKMENLLFIFSCIAKYINTEDTKTFDNITILFFTIFEIPKEYVQIIRTVTDIVDSCPEIFASSKDLLTKAFKYLVNGLDNSLTLQYCSVSARDLLSKNRESMSEFRNELLSLYEQKLKNKILESDKYLYIVEGLINVLTYSDENNNNYELIKNNIIQIMKQWVLYLREAKRLLEKNNSLLPEDNLRLNQLLLILKSISSAAFEGLKEENKKIMYEIFEEIQATIFYILNKLSTDSDIVENAIQFIKIYMRGLTENFIKYIPEYVNSIINGYKLTPISSYLYAFEILVTAYPRRKEEEIKSLLNNTFNELCKITLNNYIKSEFGLNIVVQIGEDFYGMLYRTMKSSPTILLESDMFDSLITTSIKYLNTTQIQIAKNIMIFLQNIIKCEQSNSFQEMRKEDSISAEKYKKIIQTQINKFSTILCEKILKVFIESSVSQIIEAVIELLTEFIKYQKSLVVKGMEIYLKDFPNDILTNKEKIYFLKLINEYSDNDEIKRKEFNRFIDNFENRCISKQVRGRKTN